MMRTLTQCYRFEDLIKLFLTDPKVNIPCLSSRIFNTLTPCICVMRNPAQKEALLSFKIILCILKKVVCKRVATFYQVYSSKPPVQDGQVQHQRVINSWLRLKSSRFKQQKMAVMYILDMCIEKKKEWSRKKKQDPSESTFLINFMVLYISTAVQMCYYVAVKMRISFMI